MLRDWVQSDELPLQQRLCMKDQVLINTPLQRGGFGQSNSFEPFLTVFSSCTRAGFAVIKSERNSHFTRGRTQ